jgi:SPX domain protein involved in polyphosphate accumulation
MRFDNFSDYSPRFEKKFFIENNLEMNCNLIIKKNSGLFRELYPPRTICNIYFDDHKRSLYWANVDGLSERLKVRVRWYGDLYSNIAKPVLEIKVKKGELGIKHSYPLKGFSFNSDLSMESFKRSLFDSELPDHLKEYLKSLSPSLINSYEREYFISREREVRLTLDKNLTFVNVISSRHRIDNTEVRIIELKYLNSESQISYVKKITNDFPFRLSRFSKYVTGISRLYDSPI